LGVVGCDLVVHLMEDATGHTSIVRWRTRRLHFTWRGHSLMVPYWPAYSGSLGVKGLLKTQSLVWFGLAIVLEVAALSYSERIDELVDADLSYSQRQIVAALTKAGEALNRTEVLNGDNLRLQEEVLKFRIQLADRHLTPDQQRMIGAALRRFGRRGQRVDDVTRSVSREVWTESISDGEARRLCKDIYDALNGSVPVRDFCGLGRISAAPDGFSVLPGAILIGNDDEEFANALSDALISIGKLIPAKGTTTPIPYPFRGFDTVLLVGPKPQ
jgi:hypothetical protein